MAEKTTPLKVPPHDIEAEQAVLCGMFLNPSIVPFVMQEIRPEDFYREAHQEICRAFFDLKKSADPVTVRDWLERHGILEQAGGAQYLFSISDAASTSAGYRHWCSIIRALSIRRELIQLCSKTSEACYQAWEEPGAILSDTKAGIRDIEAQNEGKEEESTPILIENAFRRLEERAAREDPYNGIKTGFTDLDNRQRGCPPKTTTYLIARPSIGKTALSLNIARNVAHENKDKLVLFFTLESSSNQLIDRILTASSKVPYSRLQSADLTERDYRNLTDSISNEMRSLANLRIYEASRYSMVDTLCAKCETVAMDYAISLIVVDHIQLMRCHNTRQSRNDQLGEISQKFQYLAKDLNAHLLILCQLNRAGEGERPKLSHMRDSGNLEQNADHVWGLYRESKESDTAELEQLKGRDKGCWGIKLYFDRATQRFDGYHETDI